MDKTYCAKSAQQAAQELWRFEQPYNFQSTDASRPVYSIDTPPPTVSGNLHIGHIFSYTHTDILARYRRMRGYNVFYPMGFDDNGLPTERYVEKKHKTKAHLLGRSKFIQLCRDEVKTIHEEFKALWQEMGLSVDWRYTYSTISDISQKVAQENFLELLSNNHVYRTATPALYCSTCFTSVAQAELESMQMSTTFNTILFKDAEGNAYPVATTRPEMLAGCVAILYHPEDSRFTHLQGKTLYSPYYRKEVPCIADFDVLPDKGTGLVMCCTFGDQTDVEWYHRHNLPFIQVFDERGIWNELTGPLAGKKCVEARATILALLEEEGSLSEQKNLVHAVNIHERCKQPIEFLIISQWFVRIKDHKEKFLALGEKVSWHPTFMHARYKDWVEHLGWDWCISRQRFYGVPFPVWHCQECQAVLPAPQESLPIDPTEKSYPGGNCSCGSSNLKADTDVMDTWNISSLTPQLNLATVAHHEKTTGSLTLPFSLRPQAHDIIRTWAFDTIVKSGYAYNDIPWHTIVISGHVTQGSGKISKSAGGGQLTPENLLKNHSVDAVRYWTAKGSPGVDTAFSEEQLKNGGRLQTKLWNAFRFIGQHVTHRPLEPSLPADTVDQWLLTRCKQVLFHYAELFEQAEYARALDTLEHFFWHDFCDNYLELVKDRLFNPEKYDDVQQNWTLYTLYSVGFQLLQLYAPYMPYITEAIYQSLYRSHEKTTTLHKTLFTIPQELAKMPNITQSVMNNLLHVVSEVRKQKSEAQCSLKTPLSKLLLTVSNQTLQVALQREESTICGITKAEQCDVAVECNAPELALVAMEIGVAEEHEGSV